MLHHDDSNLVKCVFCLCCTLHAACPSSPYLGQCQREGWQRERYSPDIKTKGCPPAIRSFIAIFRSAGADSITEPIILCNCINATRAGASGKDQAQFAAGLAVPSHQNASARIDSISGRLKSTSPSCAAVSRAPRACQMSS